MAESVVSALALGSRSSFRTEEGGAVPAFLVQRKTVVDVAALHLVHCYNPDTALLQSPTL